jgi:hypothetical protein
MQQPAFEFHHEPTRPTVNQARDQAMAQVEAHAERVRARFVEDAKAYMLVYLATHDNAPASGEELSRACKAQGIVPHDDRAFGPVLMALSKEGFIKKCGSCRRERGHGTAGGNLWKLVLGMTCMHGVPIVAGGKLRACAQCQTEPGD